MKIFAGHVNFQNHMPDGHVNQMLNVKSWIDYHCINPSHPEQNGWFMEDIFRYIYVKERFCILIEISLEFLPKGPIDNNPTLS